MATLAAEATEATEATLAAFFAASTSTRRCREEKLLTRNLVAGNLRLPLG